MYWLSQMALFPLKGEVQPTFRRVSEEELVKDASVAFARDIRPLSKLLFGLDSVLGHLTARIRRG